MALIQSVLQKLSGPAQVAPSSPTVPPDAPGRQCNRFRLYCVSTDFVARCGLQIPRGSTAVPPWWRALMPPHGHSGSTLRGPINQREPLTTSLNHPLPSTWKRNCGAARVGESFADPLPAPAQLASLAARADREVEACVHQVKALLVSAAEWLRRSRKYLSSDLAVTAPNGTIRALPSLPRRMIAIAAARSTSSTVRANNSPARNPHSASNRTIPRLGGRAAAHRRMLGRALSAGPLTTPASTVCRPSARLLRAADRRGSPPRAPATY